MQPRRKQQKKNKTAMNMVGALLAHFRIRAALTQQELAERLCMSADKIASIEQGRRPLHIVDAEHIDKVLNTTGELAAAISEMPEQENIPLWSVALMENEQRARSFHSYEPLVIPGLLQTEEYARAVLRCVYPPVDEEEFERRFRNRMERQQLLQRTPPPAMSHVIDESALMRPIGSPECLRRQIRHLRDLADLPFLGLSVMPLDRQIHAALDGGMVLLETEEFERLAYSEGGNCVEVAACPHTVHVRDSKNPTGPTLTLALATWAAFTALPLAAS